MGRALSRHGIAVVRLRNGLRWRLDLRNPTHRWIAYGYYDPPFLKWAERRLEPSGIVVDSGANIGQTALYLGEDVPQGKLLAFEPGRHPADWLAECLRLNPGRLGSVELHRAALGEAPAERFLEDTWRSERYHGGSSSVSTTRGEPITVVRLSDFLNARGIATVDLWKLDVEGYELEALRGASEHLSARSIKALYVELYREDKPEYFEHGLEIRRYLAGFGYRCHIFTGSGGRTALERKPTRAMNGLFLPA